ncbi:MAG: TRAP transporter small permease subunit [Lewinella sp.]|nr:TRAP transporter small permease subunit [Lewinella sp.]
MENIAGVIDRINEKVGRMVSWLTTALVVLVMADVIFRYLFNTSKAWTIELEWHLFALIFLFGAGYAMKHDRHVRVDLFYTRFSARDKALVNFIGGLIFLIPWCTLVIYSAWRYAMESFRIREMSPDPGGLPAIYFIKFAIVIGIFLLLLQGIAEVLRAYLTLRKTSSETKDLD